MNAPSVPALADKVILVTRPRQQANRLCELIGRQGGTALSLPTIAIEASADTGVYQNSPNYWSAFDMIIFVSRNAVIWAFKTIIRAADLDNARIIAIGEGSAEELAKHGIKRVLHAGPEAGSEALMGLDQLQSAQIKTRRIVIIKGEGGRTLLRDNLSARGAVVVTVNVYKRTMPVYEVEYLIDIWQRHQPDAIVATSNEGLQNLVKLTPELVSGQLFSSALVAMSQRTMELAARLGFKNKIFVADEQSDAGLLRALSEIIKEDKQ